MRCLICNENFNVEILENHYQYYNLVNKKNYFFKELFLPDGNRKNYDECHIRFQNCQQRKNQNVLFHRNQQIGGVLNQPRPINFHGRGSIINNLINYQQIIMTFTMKVLLIVFLFHAWCIYTYWFWDEISGIFWAKKLSTNRNRWNRKYKGLVDKCICWKIFQSIC